jgi:general stress protein 26
MIEPTKDQIGILWFFTNPETLKILKVSGPFPPKEEKVSILIVYDDNNFISPWPREKDGVYEKGKLEEWEWGNETDTEAWYEGTKCGLGGIVETRMEQAVRIYSSQKVIK